MCYSPVSICHQSSVRTSNLTYIITQTMPFDSLGALYSKGLGKIPVRSPTTGCQRQMGQVKLCSFLYHLCHNCLRRLTTEKLCHSAGGMIHYTPVVFYSVVMSTTFNCTFVQVCWLWHETSQASSSLAVTVEPLITVHVQNYVGFRLKCDCIQNQ